MENNVKKIFHTFSLYKNILNGNKFINNIQDITFI